MNSWQPIETAPRDGRWFLTTGYAYGDPGNGRFYAVAKYFEPDGWENPYCSGIGPLVSATHWMRLPALPDGVVHSDRGPQALERPPDNGDER